MCDLCACICIILIHGESDSPVYMCIYIYSYMYVYIYTVSLLFARETCISASPDFLPSRPVDVISLIKDLSSAAVVMVYVIAIFYMSFKNQNINLRILHYE